MNLVRNHVIYYKRQCESELDPGDYPPEYQLETPPEVDVNYVARAEEIRKNAWKSLEAYEQNPDYKWLTEHVGMMTDKQIKETGITNVIHYPEALRFFIKNDQLVDMRRHEDPERYMESFSRCRKRVEGMVAEKKELPVGQLTLFETSFGFNLEIVPNTGAGQIPDQETFIAVAEKENLPYDSLERILEAIGYRINIYQ